MLINAIITVSWIFVKRISIVWPKPISDEKAQTVIFYFFKILYESISKPDWFRGQNFVVGFDSKILVLASM